MASYRAVSKRLQFLITLALCACASGWTVHTDHDPAADFSTYGRFSWLPRPVEMTGEPRVDNPLLHIRVRFAVEQELASKGYEKILEGTPDFYIGYHLSLTTKLDALAADAYYGYGTGGRWRRMGIPETRYFEYEEGTLILDIVDAKLGKLVWRGSGQRRIGDPSTTPEESERRVREAVAEVLKYFLPE